MRKIKVGMGFDVHRLVEGRELWLGGIRIEHERGLLGIDSKVLLGRTVELIAADGWHVGNVDVTVCAEQPKLNPHIPAMTACLAPILGIGEEDLSIKATTTEKLGYTGRGEGMAAYAVALIER